MGCDKGEEAGWKIGLHHVGIAAGVGFSLADGFCVDETVKRGARNEQGGCILCAFASG